MQNRVSSITEARDIIDKFHARKIMIHNGKRWSVASVKRIIPMISNYPKGPIDDIEILINKEKNHYFSALCLFGKRSWVKDIRICDDYNRNSLKMVAIHPTPKNDEMIIRVARFIKLIYLKQKTK
jgi:hypothetical protein